MYFTAVMHFAQLDDIFEPLRVDAGSYVLFLLDEYFEGNELVDRIPMKDADMIRFMDVTDEPKTKVVDALVEEVMSEMGKPPRFGCRNWRW